jgi:hypothetical protein
MSSGMRGRAGMILAFRLRRVARGRQRKVLISAAGAGPPPFASIMTDRTLDNSELSGVPNAATSRMGSSFRASLSLLSHTPKQITPSFSVGAGRWRQEGEGGREVCWRQITSPGRHRARGEWPGRAKEKTSMSTNAPALKKSTGVGGTVENECRPLAT